MPWKNRYIGNPLLTGALNLIFGAGVSDAHRGLRALTKACFERLHLSGHGMEFASDVGGGTGVIAQTTMNLFCLERVASVDVKNRFLKSLNIETAIYDGRNLPFPDASFDCIILLNVLHHVPKKSRLQLLGECKRVAGAGPLYIKDHVSAGYLDAARLTVLDLLGNVPFQGMLQANYSTAQEWSDLAAPAGYSIIEQCSGLYRNGLFAKLFPNRLETTMKWRPI
jgi:ubiquinone/menaquinone biosynthesis C-methylase UbiE